MFSKEIIFFLCLFAIWQVQCHKEKHKLDLSEFYYSEHQKDNLHLNDDILLKLEQIGRIEDEIKESLNKIDINQMPDKTDLVASEYRIRNVIEMVNKKLVTVENNLQNSINTKFQILENNIHREIKELADTVKTLLALNTKPKEKMDTGCATKSILKSKGTIKSEMVAPKIINQHKIYSFCKTINMPNNTNFIREEITKNDSKITQKAEIKPSIPETADNVIDYQDDVMNNLCDFKVPSSIEIKNDVRLVKQEPEKDDLDKLTKDKTGCKYSAIMPYGGFDPPAVYFDGTTIKWYFAVRAHDKAYIDVKCGDSAQSYGFLLGEEENTSTRVFQWNPNLLLSKLPTSRILSSRRYIPFYIEIHNGTLIFGEVCSMEPLYSRNITISVGQNVEFTLRSHSVYGAKYLYGCTNKLTGPL